VSHHIDLEKPESYEADYNRALRMLELDIADTVEMDEGTFRNLVEDEWGWSRNFGATTAHYLTDDAPF
jgi:hypothetical protein